MYLNTLILLKILVKQDVLCRLHTSVCSIMRMFKIVKQHSFLILECV